LTTELFIEKVAGSYSPVVIPLDPDNVSLELLYIALTVAYGEKPPLRNDPKRRKCRVSDNARNIGFSCIPRFSEDTALVSSQDIPLLCGG